MTSARPRTTPRARTTPTVRPRSLLVPYASLAEGVRFEDLEDGPPSPPHVGGIIARLLRREGSLLAAVVGLRKDLTSVKAMLKDPDWDIPGG